MPIVAKGKILELFKDDPPETRRHVESLNKSLPGNITVEMGLDLFHLSELLGDEKPGSTGEFKRRLDARALPSEFLSGWDDFIAKYGFRGPMELDIASLRYYDKPELLLGQISAVMPARGTDMSPLAVFERSQTERRAAYEILSRKAKDKGWMTSKLFEHLYGIIENFGAYRENHKYYLIMGLERMRRKVLKAASPLVSAGRLDSPSDIFNLTVDDLAAAIKNPGLDLRALIAERRRYVDKLVKVKELPHLIDSRGRIPRPPRKNRQDGEIAGEGVSSGVARGACQGPVEPGREAHPPRRHTRRQGDRPRLDSAFHQRRRHRARGRRSSAARITGRPRVRKALRGGHREPHKPPPRRTDGRGRRLRGRRQSP